MADQRNARPEGLDGEASAERFEDAIRLVSELGLEVERHPFASTPEGRRLVSALAAVPPFADWNGAMIMIDANGSRGEYTGPIHLAEELRKGRSADDLVHAFADLVRRNAAPFVDVYLLRGVMVDAATKFDDVVTLVPVNEAPAGRGHDALFKTYEHKRIMDIPDGPSRERSRCAILLTSMLEPITFTDAGQHFPRITEKAIERAETAEDVRRAALIAGDTCVSLPGFYSQPDTPDLRQSAATIMMSGMDGIIPSNIPGPSIDDVLQWYRRLHGLPSADRNVVRIAIDRIGSARFAHKEVDAALDLGMAMEVLLIREGDGKSELTHKIQMRAGWLLGSDLATRKANAKTASQLYGARSTAAHTGQAQARFSRTSSDAFVTGIARTILERGQLPNWGDLIFGG